MKHINITNWQGNITDWTKFNYIYGGLDDTLADRVNLRIPGTNLRNYIKKSDNLLQLANTSGTINGITYAVSNGTITLNGTATRGVNIYLEIGEIILNGDYFYTEFSSVSGVSRALRYNTTNVQNLYSPITFLQTNAKANKYLLYIATGTTVTNGTIKPMLVQGTTAPTVYAPYGSMVMVENVGTVDLGTLNWAAHKISSSADCRMMSSDLSSVIALSSSDAVPANISCPKYKTLSANDTYLKITGISVDGRGRIAVYDENYNQSTSASAFKEAMNGVYVTYELKEPKVTVFNQVDLGESASQPSANTLSMASPMQLDKTNVEEDIEYLEDTKFNEEILSEEE